MEPCKNTKSDPELKERYVVVGLAGSFRVMTIGYIR